MITSNSISGSLCQETFGVFSYLCDPVLVTSARLDLSLSTRLFISVSDVCWFIQEQKKKKQAIVLRSSVAPVDAS